MSEFGGDMVGKSVQLVVSPSSLVFYTNDATSHKQLLTIYNPYDYEVAFKIYSTAPNKYSVVEPRGIIQPKKCMDLTVRHKEPIGENEGKVDKFRLSFTAHGHSGQVLTGKKDIPSTLLASSRLGPRRISNEIERNSSFETTATADWINQQRRTALGSASVAGGEPDIAAGSELVSPHRPSPHIVRPSNSTLWLLVAVGLVCILILFLPIRSPNCPSQSQQQPSTSDAKTQFQEYWESVWPLAWLPHSLEVSHQCQLVAAYILGLISLAILR